MHHDQRPRPAGAAGCAAEIKRRHALREAFPSTFGSLCDESEVHVDAESTAVELDDAGQAPAPRWARIKEAAEQADALTVEEAECSVDDPFAGGDRS